MKKVLISLFFLVLCAACGCGAFFFLREGKTQREQELKPKPKLVSLKDVTIREGEDLPESVTHIKVTEAVDTVQVDVSEVNTRKAGTYPIYYTFKGGDGKTYQADISCTVEAKEKQKPEEKAVPEYGTQEKAVPESGTQVKVAEGPPKTGDEWRMMQYVLLMIMSLTGFGWIWHVRRANRKI